MRGKDRELCCCLEGPIDKSHPIDSLNMTHRDISDNDLMLKSCPITFNVSEGLD